MLELIHSTRRRRLRRLAANRAVPLSPPVLTVFGSCRAYDPCLLLAKTGRAVLNQANIFGFVHSSGEVLQQFRLITGARTAPGRLRPYLNIGELWRGAPVQTEVAAIFALTDVFIVEISSIRQVRFKALLLQINRTRELLATDTKLLRDWWEPLVSTGVNAFADAAPDGVSAVAREIMSGITVVEQSVAAIAHDVETIARLLGKPVVFVPHFNTDGFGLPVPQRARIVEALAAARLPKNCAVFDPTPLIHQHGIGNALADRAHYAPNFRPVVADALLATVAAVRLVGGDIAASGVHADGSAVS